MGTNTLSVGPEQSPAELQLINKRQLAEAMKVSIRTVDNWISSKRIPFVRLSARCIRFHLPSVMVALRRYETKEVR